MARPPHLHLTIPVVNNVHGFVHQPGSRGLKESTCTVRGRSSTPVAATAAEGRQNFRLLGMRRDPELSHKHDMVCRLPDGLFCTLANFRICQVLARCRACFCSEFHKMHMLLCRAGSLTVLQSEVSLESMVQTALLKVTKG